MNTEGQILYWLEIAEYDIVTANAMLKTERFLYVGFMCHQAVEKALKGYYVYQTHKVPAFTHRLSYLTEKTGLEKMLSESQKDLIDELEPLNIEARYPTYKERLLKSLTKDHCLIIIGKTREFIEWIKDKMQ